MKTFKVTLKRGLIGANKTQKDTIRCLGLRGIGSTVIVKDNPAQRGQMFRMQQWLDIKVQN